MSASSLSEGKKAVLDALAERLAKASMRVFAALVPESPHASDAEPEPALRAMREASEPAVARFLDDAKHAPWIAEPAFMVAVLEIAEAGMKAWRSSTLRQHSPTSRMN